MEVVDMFKQSFLFALFLLVLISCSTVQYIEPEMRVEVDSLVLWDGYWIIPFPEEAKQVGVEISKFPDNDDYWSPCDDIVINDKLNRVEIYDYDRGYAGRYYRLTYYF
jgi:hypothetical protein